MRFTGLLRRSERVREAARPLLLGGHVSHYICLSIYVYIYIYIYTQTHRYRYTCLYIIIVIHIVRMCVTRSHTYISTAGSTLAFSYVNALFVMLDVIPYAISSSIGVCTGGMIWRQTSYATVSWRLIFGCDAHVYNPWAKDVASGFKGTSTANLRTKILDFRGLDSSIILILRGGTPRPIGDFPESWSQGILAGRLLVGRLGVLWPPARQARSHRTMWSTSILD